MARPSQQKRVERPLAAPDPDEAAAVKRAAEALVSVCAPAANMNPEAIVFTVVSAWIIERTRLAAGRRLTETVAYDLGDARCRGVIEAALPSLGEALVDLPGDVAFFDLPKELVVNVILAGLYAAHDAAVSLNEANSFPFDDAIPFGGVS